MYLHQDLQRLGRSCRLGHLCDLPSLRMQRERELHHHRLLTHYQLSLLLVLF